MDAALPSRLASGIVSRVQPIEEPVSRTDQALLRRLVLQHKAVERRHRFPAELHVGGPGRPEVGRVVESAADLDHALRCEVLGAILLRAGAASTMAWLTRPGDLAAQDVDLAWLRAIAASSGEIGRPVRFVVVTRSGWRDPWTGVGRTWARLRQR